MGELAFKEFFDAALTLSYEQRLNLILLLANSLKNYQNSDFSAEDDYKKMEATVSRFNMNVMWEELKNDTW